MYENRERLVEPTSREKVNGCNGYPFGRLLRQSLFAAFLTICLTSHAQQSPVENISKEQLVSALQTAGLNVGANVWLRHPMLDVKTYNAVPGLSKIRVKDLDVRPKYDFSKTDQHVVMVAEFGESEYVLELSRYAFLYRPDDTVEKFYLADPTAKTSKWGKRALKAISERKVFVGMTQEQVEASWGKPGRINSSGGRWGAREQWIFGEAGSSYLYFENGRLSSWQN